MKRVISAFFIVLMLFSFSACFGSGFFIERQVNSFEVSVNDIEKISLDARAIGVELLPGSSDTIKVVEYSDSAKIYNSDHKLRYTTENGILKIYQQDISRLWNTSAGITCKIYLPKSFAGDIYLNIAAGGVNIEDDFPIKSLKISIAVGGVAIKRLAIPEVVINVEAGGIEYKIPKSHSFKYEFYTELGGVDCSFSTSNTGEFGSNPTATIFLSTSAGGISVSLF